MKVKVCEPKPVPPPKKTYDLLGLTQDEIDTLLVMFARVGGSETKTARRHTAAMARAIEKAGRSWIVSPLNDRLDEFEEEMRRKHKGAWSNSIMFPEDTDDETC